MAGEQLKLLTATSELRRIHIRPHRLYPIGITHKDQLGAEIGYQSGTAFNMTWNKKHLTNDEIEHRHVVNPLIDIGLAWIK